MLGVPGLSVLKATDRGVTLSELGQSSRSAATALLGTLRHNDGAKRAPILQMRCIELHLSVVYNDLRPQFGADGLPWW